LSYSAEFAVSVGQWEYVHLTISGEEFSDLFLGKDVDMEVALGDYHASLKAAVLYGRDQAVKALSEPIKKAAPSLAPEELIIQELDAKVIDVQDRAQKPWERPVEAVPVKPWEVVAEQSAKPAGDPFADF
jgi:hypothetical protein